MSYFYQMLAFLLAIGPLVIFHELGHYAVARLCGVKVLRFSFGFGQVVWSRRFGRDQTEWAISALPLGGYVKMLDSRDPATAPKTDEEAKREFTRQSVWRRIAILAAGPLANFIVAIALFSGLYMHGMEDASTRIRHMADTSAVYQAGLRGGDQILAVNDTPVATWTDLRWEVLQAALDKSEIRLAVSQQGGARFSALIPAATLDGIDLEGDVLGALGLMVERPPAVVGKLPAGGPADRAGLKTGDLVTGIDGKPVRDVIDVVRVVRASKGSTLAFSGTRAGQPFTLEVTPDVDPATKVAVIQAEFASVPEMVTVPVGPISAVGKAVRTTWETSSMTVRMIGKMITGQVSWKNVTGPFTIADYAEKTARLGPVDFLRFIAFISISLGVMNLLPIPVLDGGYLLYYSLEVLTGRPLPERIVDFAQRAGFGLLVMLMMLAIFNDVARRL
ncbi:MAG: RIP metalloprotease RseP [Pseudomonadota bacterium]